MANITILPPRAGTNRSLGFQTQEPFTSPDMVNFVPFNPRDGRDILSPRPFLVNFTSPGTGGNLLELISGDNPGNPSRTAVVAVDGSLFFWDGSAWAAANVNAGETITTGRPVFGTPFFRNLFIANDQADGGMLQYDYNTNTLQTPSATAGSFPADARVVATHMGTLWAAGSATLGNVLQGSRTGDPFDWDFTETDDGAPFQTTGSNAGLINEPITALIPVASDMMVVASDSSMSMMIGHPSRGGIFFPLSDTMGVLGQGAHAKTFDNRVFAMSRKGLIQIQAQGDGVASLVSERTLPQALKGIPFSRLNPTISMAPDTRWNAIHIVVKDDTTPQAWWYDLANGGLYRMSFGDTLPTRLLQFDDIIEFSKSGVLYAGEGYGGMARMQATGTELSRPQAWAFLGPVRIHSEAAPQTTGRIQRAKLTLSNDTDTSLGTVSVFTGTDAEDAFLRAANSVMGTGFATTNEVIGNNDGAFYPRLSGAATVIVLGDGGTGTYGFESMDLEVVPGGRNRLPKAKGLTYDPEFGLDSYNPDFNLPATTGYVTYSATGDLSASITDSPNFLDLSKAPPRWWRGISSLDGSEIKATDESNNRLPMHILWFDRTLEQGMAVVKLTQTGTTNVRLWTKTSQTSLPAEGDTYGQFNAYASWIKVMWALGDGVDVTSNQIDNAALQSAVDGFVTSPQGFRSAFLEDTGTSSFEEAIADQSGKIAVACLTEMPSDDSDSVTWAISGTGAYVIGRLHGASPKRVRVVGLGETLDDDTLYPASTYFTSWAFVGSIADDPGNTIHLSTPTLITNKAATGSFPGTPHNVKLQVNRNSGVNIKHAMLQLLDATNDSEILAYFEMMHEIVDGDFWSTGALVSADESLISE